jgi:hypothetical protein
MGSDDDRAELRRNITRLKALLDAEQGLAPETRVTALASVVQAQSSLLAADAMDRLRTAVDAAGGDVVAPLATALYAFEETAGRLVNALQQLPG